MTTRKTYEPRTAHNGQPRWHSLDPLSELRVAFSKHTARNHFGVPASASTIVRRALQLYGSHIDELIELPRDDVRVDLERLALHQANQGELTRADRDKLDYTIKTGPLRPLKDILKENV